MNHMQKTLVIVSGYFNPIHTGHINLIKSARELGDKLLVIVNNDEQQQQKKGKIIMDQWNRMDVVETLRDVDEVVLSIDTDRTVVKTLEKIARVYTSEDFTSLFGEFAMIFANGGDRDSEKAIPETDICNAYGIKLRFGVGGTDKAFSSSDINKRRGLE